MHTLEKKALYLQFAIELDDLALIDAHCVDSPPPLGEPKPLTPVDASIIGHWVEIYDRDGELQFRQFLRGMLPLQHLRSSDTLQARRRLRRQPAQPRLELVVPVSEHDEHLVLYEQALPAPSAKSLQRSVQMTLNLKECLLKARGCGKQRLTNPQEMAF